MKISNKSSTIQDYIKLHHLEEVFDLKVIELLQLHYFDANEPIIDEATDVKYLYLVLEGESRVSPATQEGKIGFLEFIYPMDVIGDLEYFSGDTYYHNVVALSPCTFLAIPVLLIEKHFNHNINFYRLICENMACKMKRTSSRYSSSMLYPLKNRLAKYLFDLVKRSQSKVISLPVTQIAAYFGVTPRHLRRVLNSFEDEGILLKEKSKITLLDIDKLKSYMANIP